MGKRFRIFTLALTIMLSLCLSMFGVYSAIQVSFNVNSTISFIAEGVKIEANGAIYRGDSLTMTQLTEEDRPSTDTTPNATYVMENYRNYELTEDGEIANTDSTENLPEWVIGEVQFLSDQKVIEVRISFTNYSDFPIAISVSNHTQASSTIDMFEESDGLSYVPYGNTVYYTLRFTLNSTAGNSTLVIDIDISFEEAGSLGDYLEWDENGYWTLTMGEYQGTPLKWRMVLKENEEETDVESVANYVETTPLQGTYYFLLDTYIANVFNCSFENWYRSSSGYPRLDQYGSAVNVNDYAVSNIREYLTGVNVYRGYTRSGSSSSNYTYTPSTDNVTGQTERENFITKFNIDSSPVYSMIEGRTLSDLYSRMYSSTAGNPVDFDTDVLIPQDTKDKLWLLSYYEASKITMTQGTAADSGARSWDATYWLRSPYSSSTNYVSSVNASGYIGNSGNAYATLCARPAFKISFS